VPVLCFSPPSGASLACLTQSGVPALRVIDLGRAKTSNLHLLFYPQKEEYLSGQKCFACSESYSAQVPLTHKPGGKTCARKEESRKFFDPLTPGRVSGSGLPDPLNGLPGRHCGQELSAGRKKTAINPIFFHPAGTRLPAGRSPRWCRSCASALCVVDLCRAKTSNLNLMFFPQKEE